MTTQQLILSLVLATMVFSVALELKVSDFTRVAQTPRAVLCGLIPQFVLLPGATWLATLALELPPNIEAAMLLVAACPGGSLSNVVTHQGRGNTALSVSISAVASVLALFFTPFNFTWMMATNPVTASWMRPLAIDPSDILFSLLALLALPMALSGARPLPARADREDPQAARQLQPGRTARVHRDRAGAAARAADPADPAAARDRCAAQRTRPGARLVVRAGVPGR
jgi:BASS family bile acid:Na+ symporter